RCDHQMGCGTCNTSPNQWTRQ
ncbi:ubiD decarboxylase family protein, partial [Vibrio parahaemolyticus V-223/04]